MKIEKSAKNNRRYYITYVEFLIFFLKKEEKSMVKGCYTYGFVYVSSCFT